ncbi:hypothetical protein P7K49_025071 [Saguinus oedipus]|uniref:Uncharacterized protein n=1 Tax=Saguinus oedipus TaxID=9490 RepID=A0ABQ9UID5_SAGOE|nr:hypothetical protein P7K49_025071 [Saguinus oedipus]
MLYNTTCLFTEEKILGNNLSVLLDFIVQDKHKNTTQASENTGPCTLEKSFASFIRSHLLPAVKCVCVHDVSASAPSLHHRASANGVKQIGSQPSIGSDRLCDHPADDDVSVLGIRKHSLCSVTDKAAGNTLHRNVKALVQALHRVRFVDPNQAVADAWEFPFSSSFTHADLLVFISEGGVESLGREGSDDIGPFPVSEGRDSLLLGNSNQPSVTPRTASLRWSACSMLHLQRQLDPLDGRYRRPGDRCGHSTCPKSLAKDTAANVKLKGKRRQAAVGWDWAGHWL